MKVRLFTVFALLIGLALLVTWAMDAQPSKAASSAQSGASFAFIDRSGPPSNHQSVVKLAHTSNVAFTPTFTSYLPAVLNNYVSYAPVPILLGPADGSNLDTLAPLFMWNNGDNPGVTRVRLAIAKDSSFTQTVASLWTSYSSGVDEFRFSRNFDPATTYYWRAWFMWDDVEGPYSEVWSFTTGSNGTILPAPVLLAPPNGSTLPSTGATLQWSPVSGAQEYLVHWRAAGSSGYSWTWTADTQAQVGCGTNTTCEWWVAARNDYAVGADSEIWQFTTTGGLSQSFEDLSHNATIEEDGTSTTFESYR